MTCAGNAARGWQGATCWLSAERTSLMGGVVYVSWTSWQGTEMRSKGETRSVPRRAVSFARSRKVSSVWYVPVDQQEGPLPSRCWSGRRWRRKGAPSIEKLPVKEQGLCGSMESKSKIATKTTIGETGGTLPQWQAKPETTPHCKGIGRGHRMSPAGFFEQVLGDYSLS